MSNKKFSHYISYINGSGNTEKSILCYEDTPLTDFVKDLKKYYAIKVIKRRWQIK
jgi:hypothetical protein